MTLLFLAYLGGVLTIVSPCILPVLPFVFARSDQPFRRTGLPLLIGMAVTFALIASLATVGGGWIVRANQFGRAAALVLFAVFGLTLLFPSLSERLARPLVGLGNRVSRGGSSGSGVANSFLLGIGTGLLWAPCAGPILGLILTGAALGGPTVRTTSLLLAYATGAATSLAVALSAGSRVFAAMKRSLGADAWIRGVLGGAVLAGVLAVAFGLDRGVLAQLSLASTGDLEQHLVSRFTPQVVATTAQNHTRPRTETGEGAKSLTATEQPTTPPNTTMWATATGSAIPPGQLAGATAWINSTPLTLASLHGKVVLVDFWTYSCINCLRTLPYIKTWNERYKEDGLVIVGVHTPEFPFEKDEANVRKAVHDLGITYPVAMDNEYRIWRSFNNEYWPADYLIDASGRLRHHHFGEGSYEETETWIRALLQEANARALPNDSGRIAASGAEAAADTGDVRSPETYIGYSRAQNFVSPGGIDKNGPQAYKAPESLQLNQWALTGRWDDGAQIATSLTPSSSIVYRFHARDLHLVLGPSKGHGAVRFRVTLDGHEPGADHGTDIDSAGYGVLTEHRLYQLIRQHGAIQDRTFRIDFLSPGAQAYAFTFG